MPYDYNSFDFGYDPSSWWAFEPTLPDLSYLDSLAASPDISQGAWTNSYAPAPAEAVAPPPAPVPASAPAAYSGPVGTTSNYYTWLANQGIDVNSLGPNPQDWPTPPDSDPAYYAWNNLVNQYNVANGQGGAVLHNSNTLGGYTSPEAVQAQQWQQAQADA